MKLSEGKEFWILPTRKRGKKPSRLCLRVIEPDSFFNILFKSGIFSFNFKNIVS